MDIRYTPDETRYANLDTAGLRTGYLIDKLFQPGAIRKVYADIDRAVIVGAVPTDKPLTLETAKPLASEYFAERREIGVINIGGAGSVAVDGKAYPLEKKDCLYIGRGNKQIEFTSADAKSPAQFYCVSYPAHTAYPTTLVTPKDVKPLELGSQKDCNQRKLHQYIHLKGVKSCQLVMGFTSLAEGSIWNTMPPHTHTRRTEVYMYFDVDPDAAVFHMMGSAEETRHLIIRNGEVALSPPWSMHCGAGTRAYSFVWAMGGENQEFTDMDQIPVAALK